MSNKTEAFLQSSFPSSRCLFTSGRKFGYANRVVFPAYLCDLADGRRIIVIEDATFSISLQGYRNVHSQLPRSPVSANSVQLDHDYILLFSLIVTARTVAHEISAALAFRFACVKHVSSAWNIRNTSRLEGTRVFNSSFVSGGRTWRSWELKSRNWRPGKDFCDSQDNRMIPRYDVGSAVSLQRYFVLTQRHIEISPIISERMFFSMERMLSETS